MKKLFLYFTITAGILSSCNKQPVAKMTVQGEIKGLKKGTLFLQKIADNQFTTIDSAFIEETGKYQLRSDENPDEVYYLSFEKDADKMIEFFGDAGIITINTSLENFAKRKSISGSKNQEILDQFTQYNKRFISQNLDLIKENFEAKKAKDEAKIASIAEKSKKLVRRQYLFTTNFAISNKDSEVAPYLALTKLSDANLKLLDTINVSLTPEIKASVYGKELDEYVTKIKELEK